MTQNEIIEMAGQHFCRIEYGNGNVHEGYEFSFEELEAFAKLVAAHVSRELAKECAGSGEWTAVHIIERVEW